MFGILGTGIHSAGVPRKSNIAQILYLFYSYMVQLVLLHQPHKIKQTIQLPKSKQKDKTIFSEIAYILLNTITN